MSLEDNKEFENRRKLLTDLITHNSLYVPMKTKELAILLDIPKERRHELQEVLDSLVSDGTIGVSKKGKYGKPENTAFVGTFTTTKRGFGFVTVDGREDDIFVKESDTNGAFHMDKVKVVVTKQGRGGRRCEGVIVSVVEHQISELVGTYQESRNFGFVIPDNGKIGFDIFIPKEDSMGAVNGHKVVCRITDYGKARRNPSGCVTQILGHINEPGTDVLSIVKSYDIPTEFSQDVIEYLDNIPDAVQAEDTKSRLDCREWQMVTIDGEDAKDLDDAITLTESDGLYHLGVHIADVSHYVKEKSPLDKCAYERGTSVYLVDRVIPMLPQKLSNGICSLNQGVDRLALSCLMDIDFKGNVVSSKICETVVNVDRRMTYTDVKKILDGDEDKCAEYSDFTELFKRMESLAAILREKRYKRGSIDFDFPETKITLDENGNPTDVRPYDRNTATRIIEDFMLIANETVATEYYWQELPFLYRSHETPDSEKMQKLSTFINNFGYSIRTGDKMHPKEIQKLLTKIEGSDEENIIARLTLRSMQRASYTTECVGHFGLAAKYYCHFTSPIRRYPDLFIHRIIKENIHGRLDDKRQAHFNKILPETARHTSQTERRADDAERDTDKLKMTEYMEHHIGDVYEGVISGITSWGIYVELPNTIEGMIRISELSGHYEYDENHYELYNRRSGKLFKLGQRVKVVVADTDRALRTIDFMFED